MAAAATAAGAAIAAVTAAAAAAFARWRSQNALSVHSAPWPDSKS